MLTHAFRAFMAFYFAELSAQIDWSRRPRFLDKELAQAGFGDAPAGRIADQLVAVYLHDGSERWVLVHIEVQAQRDDALARRVLTYNFRIFEQHGRPVASLIVLADDDANWRPRSFHNVVLGTVMGISFAVVKLSDFAQRMAELEASRNPFALVTLAHLHCQRTRHNCADRYAAKWQLTKLLFQRGWSKKRIITLFKAINWMMTLPVALEQRYWQAVRQLERARKMEWISPLEQTFIDKGLQKGIKLGLRQGLEQGLEQGREQGAALVLEEQLTQRFGTLPQTTRRKLANASLQQLKLWSKAVLHAQSLKEVFA
ncbi:MAG: hypothetical protein K0R43_3667 [Pseudoduganella sp.]|nr:hypothetical protein [Pseudoduganella sp.]